MPGKWLLLAAWPSLLGLAAMLPSSMPNLPPADPLHAWAGPMDPARLSAWVNGHLEAQQQAIQQLLDVKTAPTIANTLAPYDRAMAELNAAGSEAGLMYSVSPDKAVRDAAEALVQKVSEASVALSLNPQVYRALAAVDATKADPATRYYLQRTLLEYRLAGVDKDEATRKRVQQLQDQITKLGLVFGRNVQEHVNTVSVSGPQELAGLPADFLAQHKPAADGSIQLTTDYTDYMPVMTYAKSGALRHRMFLAYNTRAYPANKQVLLDLLATRQELASTLGFKNWADLATADQMIGSAANVREFLAELDTASQPGAAKEYDMVLDFARKQQPGLAAISADSATYWYEQYRSQVFDFDSQSVRPYFPYDRVQQGVLDTAAKLFHVEFRPAPHAAVWDPSVTAWEVYDRDPQSKQNGQLIGRFYLDMHPREGKDKWFSAYPILPGIRGQQVPEAALICNFPGGGPGANSQSKDAGLMQYSDVVTFFHEFGHLMHAILGGQQQWAGVSGIATEGDFVEAPSQMLEEFFRNPALLQSFAKNYQTNQPIPTALVERMNRASAFGRGNWVRTQLFYTRFSLDLHDRPTASIDLDALMRTDYAAALPYTWVDGNRFYASFTHLTGYSSNYYTYLFDKVIALDFFRQFDQHNLIEGPAALRYRAAVLEPGGSEPGTELVKNFLGRPQNLQAFEQWMGEEFASPTR
jgi:thimet oligopeptidase